MMGEQRPATDRAGHLAWAKARALEYVFMEQTGAAASSLVVDLSKHPDTKWLARDIAGNMLELATAGDAPAMRRFIDGLE